MIYAKDQIIAKIKSSNIEDKQAVVNSVLSFHTEQTLLKQKEDVRVMSELKGIQKTADYILEESIEAFKNKKHETAIELQKLSERILEKKEEIQYKE